jgi:ferric-dicitrate binding protein FerR (iron transport regulator)
MDEFFQHWAFNPDDHEACTYWTKWLKDNPGKESEINEARRLLTAMRFSHYQLDEKAVVNLWDKIQARNKARRSVQQRWYWLAGVIVLAVCLVTAYGYYRNGFVEYTTAYGVTKKVVLPDNSVVVLNANSTLRYPREWNNRTTREIWISGEANFSVVHKKDHQPFKVNAGEGVSVEVLGTVFNVYNRHQQTKVVLTSGRIQLQLPVTDGDEKIVMEPGEMVEYHGMIYTRQLVNPVQYSAWTMNRLELDHTTLLELIQMVKDNYGLVIEVSDRELLKQTVSGSMPYGDANSLLQQVARSFQLSVRRDGNIFYLEEQK